MKYKAVVIRHFICILAFLVIFVLRVPCPILAFVDIPCPTCGITRAIYALLSGDIGGYIEYQPFALPLIIAMMIGFHHRYIGKSKALNTFMYLTLISNFIYYFYRLIR